jgi:hypothetical protein
MKTPPFSWLVLSVVAGLCGSFAEAAINPGDLILEFQKPNHIAKDFFGHRMASFGDRVLISSPGDDAVGSHAGAVYMYNSSGQLLQTFYNPTPYTGPAGIEYFGESLGSLGNSVLVADPYDSSVVANGGAVYMFDSGSGALQQTFLNPTGVGSPGGWLEEIEDFGGGNGSIAGVGTDKVLIGAYSKIEEGVIVPGTIGPAAFGGAYLFDRRTGQVLHTFSSPTPQVYSRFGWSVVSVGDKIAISQPWLDRPEVGVNASGAVYIYDAVTYDYLYSLVDPTPRSNNEQFGVSLAAFGDNLLVGGGEGAYVFNPNTGQRVLSLETPAVYRSQVAAVGDDILVGAQYDGLDNTGRAYLFDGQTGQRLLTIDNPFPDTFEYFGISVAAVSDRLVVGADYDDARGYHSGAAYLFQGKNIPEPTTLGLLLFGGLALLRRRK